jgi:hypothetical protein
MGRTSWQYNKRKLSWMDRMEKVPEVDGSFSIIQRHSSSLQLEKNFPHPDPTSRCKIRNKAWQLKI